MIVILDKKRHSSDYDSEFIVVNDNVALEKVNGTIDALVVGDYTSDDLDLGSLSTMISFMDSLPKVIYVRKDEETDPKLESAIRGINGVVETNVDYLDSREGINRLVKGENYNAVALTDSIDVLSEFVKNFEGGTINKGQALILENAVNEVVSDAKRKNETLQLATDTYINVIQESQELVKSIKKRSTEVKDQVRKLADALKASQRVGTTGIQMTPVAGSVISIYPSFDLERNSSRLTYIIKDLGRTPYLTTFVLGMSQYLSEKYSRDVKIVFLEPTGYLYEMKYASSVEEKRLFITQNNISQTSDKAVITPIVHTNYPMKENVGNIISRPNYTGLIIVDRLVADVRPLIRIEDVRPVYCAPSRGWFDLRGKNLPWFTSMRKKEDQGAFGYIPSYKNYANMPRLDREGAYATLSDLYEQVINLAG